MRRLLIIRLFVGLFVGVLAVGGGQATQTVDARDRFALELPEITSGLLQTMDVTIPPGSVVTRFKIWLLNPYADRVKYGGLKASLNNKSLATVTQARSGTHGKFLEVDLRQNPDLRLLPGKNFVEVTAQDESGTTYRCSFVLLPGTQKPPTPDPSPATEIRLEQMLAPEEAHAPHKDHRAPTLTLFEPKAALNAAAGPLTVRVAGEASDDSGIIVSVTVNGRRIAASPPPKPEKRDKKDKTPPPDPASIKLPFDQTVTIEASARALLVEAQDPTGNRTLVTMPILRPTIAGNSGEIRKYAVIAGVSKYRYSEGGLNDLSFAHKDAEAIRDFLKTPGGGGFKSDEIVCLTDSGATLAAVEGAVNRYLTKAGPNDLIYLFLAGHGAPDPYDQQGLYFLLHDSKVADLPNTAFPMRRLGEFLDKHSKQVRLIAFFDTCHSAGIKQQPAVSPTNSKPTGQPVRGVGSKQSGGSSGPSVTLTVGPATAPGFDFYESKLFQQKGWTVITSSALTELSQESTQWADKNGNGHGVFTWALLEGAQGKADTNGDCQITAAELFNYIKTTVSRATGNAQNPQLLPGTNGKLEVAVTPNCKR